MIPRCSRGHQVNIKELSCLSGRWWLNVHAITHPVQNVEAILQFGIFLHQLFQTHRRTRVLGVFQALNLSSQSLDLKLLKTTTIIYIKISQLYILSQVIEELKDLLGNYFEFVLHTG